jgi:hypothetical protein
MRTLAAALATLMTAAPLAAQVDFQWRGAVAQGHTVEIRGVNGPIRAMLSTGGQVRVEATKSARRSDPADVTIEVVQHGDGVTICAVYPTPAGQRQRNECVPGGGRMGTRNNDVQVAFVVHVPAGVRLAAHTVNGTIESTGLQSDVRAQTVNGNVQIATSGFAEATTVNGSISSRVGAGMNRNVSYKTVNGSISIEMPAGLNADFRASTVNGNIQTDFPVTVSGNFSRRSLRGTIGDGGPELRLETVNGSIRLRRAS